MEQERIQLWIWTKSESLEEKGEVNKLNSPSKDKITKPKKKQKFKIVIVISKNNALYADIYPENSLPQPNLNNPLKSQKNPTQNPWNMHPPN